MLVDERLIQTAPQHRRWWRRWRDAGHILRVFHTGVAPCSGARVLGWWAPCLGEAVGVHRAALQRAPQLDPARVALCNMLFYVARKVCPHRWKEVEVRPALVEEPRVLRTCGWPKEVTRPRPVRCQFVGDPVASESTPSRGISPRVGGKRRQIGGRCKTKLVGSGLHALAGRVTHVSGRQVVCANGWWTALEAQRGRKQGCGTASKLTCKEAAAKRAIRASRQRSEIY